MAGVSGKKRRSVLNLCLITKSCHSECSEESSIHTLFGGIKMDSGFPMAGLLPNTEIRRLNKSGMTRVIVPSVVTTDGRQQFLECQL